MDKNTHERCSTCGGDHDPNEPCTMEQATDSITLPPGTYEMGVAISRGAVIGVDWFPSDAQIQQMCNRSFRLAEEITELRAQLAEAMGLIGELVEPERAGWGEEHYIECLYCGAYDVVRDETIDDGNHAADCPVERARRWLAARNSED